MGRYKPVEVDLIDLKVLVDTMYEKDVLKCAEGMVLAEPGNTDDQAAFLFASLRDQAMPEARKRIERRYRRLREALESGTDVAPALKSFLHRD